MIDTSPANKTSKNSLAPVAVFAYARPKHLTQLIDSLKLDQLASKTELYIFIDGARTSEQKANVNAVQTVARNVCGFLSVHCIAAKTNKGLARSIIDGVNFLLQNYERIIVLEDDLVVSPLFLQYMNDALARFADDDRVISIHAYVYPVCDVVPEAFFLRGADCWGWGTWRRGWKLFNPDGKVLLHKLKQLDLIKEFDFNGSCKYSEMLKSQTKGQNDSWAIRWYASAFLENKLTLYPGRSLVNNVGNDNTGTHCKATNAYDSTLSTTPIDLSKLDVVSSSVAYKAFENFFKKQHHEYARSLWSRIVSNLLRVFT